MNPQQYLTVKALTKYIKRKFDADPYLTDVYVKGEISNYKRHTSGHMYFTLKDENARMLSIMFSSANRKLKFNPENGMQVLIKGDITVYEAGGQYQIYVKEMQPDGIGELYLAFEQLKEKLEKEGLFRLEIKKKLPAFPQTIGVITSPTGAAVRDIITTIKRRYPIAKILIYPALVQGDHAAASIVKAIQMVNKQQKVDTVIVGRGGGSIEELWPFNEEIVARAIHESIIPVISAVGHETDFTIADFAADMRAPTPTAAAELAVPHLDEVLERLLTKKTRLIRAVADQLKHDRKRLETVTNSYVFRNPSALYRQKMEQVDRLTEKLVKEQTYKIKHLQDTHQFLANRLERNHPEKLLKLAVEKKDHLTEQLTKQMEMLLKRKQQLFGQSVSILDALSPLKIMERGYSIAYTADHELVKSSQQLKKDDEMNIRLVDGRIFCKVMSVEESGKNER
ncbi:exodeoxyribonuclease VII large subunit [Oikeobacillus pervagus]|nr:exodeoxyribonuclease VII large subunit [Oikeobacillus pervagus]